MASVHRRHLTFLGTVFALFWLVLAIQPDNRRDWLLENLLVFTIAPTLWILRHRFVFSRLSYTLIFIFLCLHEVGAHYTYAKVPYDDAIRTVTGHSLNEFMGWKRNHFDRAVHFLYGLLLAYPIREVFLRVANARGFWGYFLPLDLTLSTSTLLELLEWGVAVIVSPELGAAYLGTQGDIWDAHKDMALAGAGALLAMLVTATVNWRLQRDFGREWSESFRVKVPEPLGDDELARMLAARRSRDPGTGTGAG